MRKNATQEKNITNRRGFILGTGMVATGLAMLRPAAVLGMEPLPAVGSWPWPAAGLDPVATAGGSTAGLAGCAVTSFGLMLNQLKEALPGSVWEGIPAQLTSAFNGGGPYGSDCGGLQGPLLIMTLVGAPMTLKQEFYKWYCDFPFPSTEWDLLYPMANTVQTTASSPLCHESRALWEGVFLRDVYPSTGVYDGTRCAKLTRDCTKKAVDLINAFKLAGYSGVWAPDSNYKSCFDCHTALYANKLPGGIHSGKEDCTRCHTVPRSHLLKNPRKGMK